MFEEISQELSILQQLLTKENISLQFTSGVIVLLITLLLYVWHRNRDLPPGPWGLPVFGYYPFLSSKPYLDFDRLSKQYGEVFSFRTAGGKLFVVLNGVRQIKDVLVNRSDEFIGRPIESNLLEWISDGLGVTQEEGVPWKQHRRYFLQTVKNFGFGKQEIEETIHEEIKILLEDLQKSKGYPTDFSFHVAYTVNSVIAKVMFDQKFDKYGELFPKLAKGVHDLISIFADHRFMLVGLPFQLAMFFLPWSTKVRKGRSVLKNTVQKIIDEHKRTFDPNHLRDYVDSYLNQMEISRKSHQLEDSTFTDERLLAISMNMTMEGTESVGDTICSLLKEASKHQNEQINVQREIDTVVGRERLPSWLDRHKLPYLDAFIQELLRVSMAFHITTHYCNFEETKINNYRIPKRTIIVGNLWAINNDPDIYPDPLRFDVTRFLDENGKRIKSDGPYPYSMGKRDCVGQSLAQMEIFIIIASVLQQFTLVSGGEEMLKAIPRH